MNRKHIIAIAAVLLIAPLVMALPYQPQSTSQTFEVASVKPYKDDATAGGVVMIGGGCRGVDSPTPGVPGGPGSPGGATQMTVMIGGGPGGGPGGGASGAGAPPPPGGG